MNEPRYIVSSVEGFFGQFTSGRPGVSCHVLDTLVNHRIVGTFRSESYKHVGRANMAKRAREDAEDRAWRLNKEHRAALAGVRP